jgi:CheY-like chemotaxis protein
MPKLNGYETARRMRQKTWGRQMLLVALTGWGQEADRMKSSDAGFNMHLVKPVDVAEIQRLLERNH